MKLSPIIIPWLSQFNKVLTGFRHHIAVDQYVPVSQICLYLHKSFRLVFLHFLIDFFPDFVLFQVSERGCCLVRGRETGTRQTCRSKVSFPFVLVHFVLHTPFDESLDIQPSFKLGFDFLLFLKLLIFLLFLKLPFEIDLLHNSWNRLVLFYFWLQFFLRHKGYIIFQVIKLSHIPFLHVLRVLYGYDIV